MLLYIVRYFFSLFVVILFCPFLLFAEDLIPEKFHGTWSNDCSKEQDVFMKAIEAYTGLILAYEKLSINQENVNLLQRQFEIDNARLSRAQITATDLAQSQSSLSGAQAGYIGAQNNIITSKLAYENIIGPINTNEKLKKIYKYKKLKFSSSFTRIFF